ncbi:hypothetical protein I6A60_16355 [Frankia sp. AgB1.9]|uniref:hypothetical protein n=1 Tax=unclassified Frankia TaxID=2632575 RepID=UPI0019321127|nr:MULTISPECIES: hypothetical protein [unclassified Frankia]MBL7488001.1 hypothetical protein [Frankia sp. AgW1.1]MBL7549439.1 hypothetical protein [Frankia sp. AgB1.9]MBL7619945.1 hypothetical protein [Frankia sp. AgB1.8]
MATVDETFPGQFAVHVKGAPEAVLDLGTSLATPDGATRKLTAADRDQVATLLDEFARAGLRVLSVADRKLPALPATGTHGPADLTRPGLETGVQCRDCQGSRNPDRS